MRKAVLHAEERVCRAEGCTTILSIYNPGKTCSVHPEVLTVKEARKSLTVGLTDKQKAYCRKYKAKVRAGVIKPKKRVVYGVPFPESASKLMDKAVNEAIRKVHGNLPGATDGDIWYDLDAQDKTRAKGGKR